MHQPKIAIGGIWHETNTFATGLTRLNDFQAYQYAAGSELTNRYTNTNTEIGGAIGAACQLGVEMVPTVFAAAVPSGTIEKQTFTDLVDQLTELISRAMPVDGVVLTLHGAAVADGIDDADAHILKCVRQVVGADIPIAATFDYHANLSDSMVRHATVLIGYDTYPHTDMANRGEEALRIVANLCTENQLLHCAHRKLPLLTSPLKQSTAESPMCEVMKTLHDIERNSAITCGSIAMGFPYSDVEHLGASVVMYGSDPKQVETAIDTIAAEIWHARHQFQADIFPVAQCVTSAMSSTEFPVVIVEPADNVGGGSAGDGTGVLVELLKQSAHDSVIVIYDPEAVNQAQRAGVGRVGNFCIGAKTDDYHGVPVNLSARVEMITTGEYEHKGSYMTGYISSMGRTALLKAQGVQIVLTSRRNMPFDSEHLRCLGIEPEEQKIIVVKAAVAWKAAFGEIAKRILIVDTPGVCTAELNRLNYSKRPQPLFPLEQDTTYSI